MKTTVCSLVLAASLVSAFASANEYILGIENGVSVAAASSGWANRFDASYVAGLRFSADFSLANDAIRLGPTIQVDGLPLNSSPSVYQSNIANAKLGEVRGLVGIELRLPAKYLELFVRALVGIDSQIGSIAYYTQGSATVNGVTTTTYMPNGREHLRTKCVGFLPQVGFMAPLAKNVGIGLSLGLPFSHNQEIYQQKPPSSATSNGKTTITDGPTTANAFDVELSAVIEAKF